MRGRFLSVSSPAAVRLVLLLVLTAASSVGAASQPAPDAVVDAWRARTRAAARGVDRVEVNETAERRIDGPRGAVEIVTVARVELAPGEQGRRTVTQATLDGAALSPERLQHLDQRYARAFGHGVAEATNELRLVPLPLARGSATRLDASDVGGRPAWRVSLDLPLPPPEQPAGRRRGRRAGPPPGPPGPPPTAEAWFSRSTDTPRLLRMRVRGELRGRAFVRTVDFSPAGGLDVPSAAETRVEVWQRRRLRSYTTLVTVRAQYAGARIVRR